MGNSNTNAGKSQNPTAGIVAPGAQKITPILIEHPDMILLVDCNNQKYQLPKKYFEDIAQQLNIKLADNDFTSNCKRVREAILNVQSDRLKQTKNNQPELSVTAFANNTCPQLLQKYNRKDWNNFYHDKKNQENLEGMDPERMNHLLMNENTWDLPLACDAIRKNFVRKNLIIPNEEENNFLLLYKQEADEYLRLMEIEAAQIAAIKAGTMQQLNR